MNEYLFSDTFTCKSCLHYDRLRTKDSALLLLLKPQILKNHFNESHILHVDRFVNPLPLLVLAPRCDGYSHLRKGNYEYISHFSSKHQSPNLNTLPLPPADRTPRVHKRRMRHPPSLLTVKTLQQNPLIIIDARPVIPPLIHVRHRNRLAGPILIPVFDRNQSLISHRLGVGERKRRALHGSIQRAPDVDDAYAAFEKR